jgi:L-threonylcarbamoyladenylate synthase
MTAVRVVQVDKAGIIQAAEIIKSGGLVAVPTETVYGLGADAMNPQAVEQIYKIKGRPTDNPLIIHISDKVKILELTDELPDYAKILVERFWPGALTLVVKKKPGLPVWLGGCPPAKLDTVGVRMPSHPVILELIQAANCFIAAPSANTAGKPSPTTAAHVLEDYKNAQATPDLVLDGGATDIGVESTVVDVTGENPLILRPGAITREMIEEALAGETVTVSFASAAHETPRAPGMKYRHYAPVAPMTLLLGTSEEIAAYIATQIVSEMDASIGVLLTPETRLKLDAKWPKMAVQSDASYAPVVTWLNLGEWSNPAEIGQNLYANLRKFDEIGVDLILAEAPEKSGLGQALFDRMIKGAEGRLINLGLD